MAETKNGESSEKTIDLESVRASVPGETTPAPTTPPPTKPASAYASVYAGPTQPLPDELLNATHAIEQAFSRPAWLLLQNQHGPFSQLDDEVWCGFFRERAHITNKPLLIIDSPGGYARSAYQLGRLFQRRGGFTAIIPRMAKSAATLLTLGASTIYMGANAELGPLDAQIPDPEREDMSSALDEVQSLERLHSAALAEIDKAMILMLARTGKRVDTLLPMMMHYEAEMMKPLLEKIDAVHYTQQSRALKVAEDYAVRLLRPRYAQQRAEEIARRLVNFYPEHGFVIDPEETAQFLDASTPNKAQADALDVFAELLNDGDYHLNVVGRVMEVTAP